MAIPPLLPKPGQPGPYPIPVPPVSLVPVPIPRECVCVRPGNYVTLPASGGNQAVGIGRTTIDFVAGVVQLAGGGTARLSDSVRPGEFMRSFFCEPDQDIDVALNEKGFYRFPANQLTGIIFFEFITVQITTTVATNLRVFASPDPRGGIVRG